MTDLRDLTDRPPLAPWAEGNTLPWDEPGFSRRMLREHLSQAHDAASRRFETIDRHVAWLHGTVAGGRAGRVLDLACGPGLYAGRLARLGHACVGIDFGPAAIEHARAEAEREGLDCAYRQADLRDGGFGEGFDLALLLSGELDVFPPADAARIVARAGRALAAGGALVLEVHRPAAVRSKGASPATWSSHASGLFADRPHLLLRETGWFEDALAAVERYFVVDTATSAVARHAITTRATPRTEHERRLREAGLEGLAWHGTLAGDGGEDDADFVVLVARRGG